MVWETSKIENIPITETKAMDRNAGCCANIKIPSPMTVVIAERKWMF